MFPSRRHPYYIAAPAWNRKSAGVRALYQLCHAFNEAGERAYINPMGSVSVPDDIKAPLLTQAIVEYHRHQGLDAIAVYPEIVHGNPMKAKHVVRWLLWYAGAYGGPKEYPETDLIYGYKPQIRDAYGSGGVLCMPVVDTALFKDIGAEREGEAYYVNKYKGLVYIAHPEDTLKITNEWPASHKELAHVLQHAKKLYVYEDTALALEAALCGCEVVQMFDAGHEKAGDMVANYKRELKEWPAQLKQFIEDTQHD